MRRRTTLDIIGEDEELSLDVEETVVPNEFINNGIDEAPINLDLEDVLTVGVDIEWLSAAFGIGTTTVRRRLTACRPMARERGKNYYSLANAAKFLVEPNIDLGALLDDVKLTNFPTRFQKDYWESKLKMQRWQVKAGQLWDTQSVMEVLADIAVSVKSTVRLWSDMVDQTRDVGPCTKEQLDELKRLSDGLLRQVHAELKDIPDRKRTNSLLMKEISEMDADIERHARSASNGGRMS